MFGFGNPYAGGGLWGRPQDSAMPPDAARWQPVGMQWPRPPDDARWQPVGMQWPRPPTQPSIPGMPPMGQGFPGGGFPGSPLGGLWGPRPPWGGPSSVGGLWGMPGGGPPMGQAFNGMGPAQTPMYGYQGANLDRMFGSNLYDTLVNSGVGPTQPLGGGTQPGQTLELRGGAHGGRITDTGPAGGAYPGKGPGLAMPDVRQGGSAFDMPGSGGAAYGSGPANAGFWNPALMAGAQPMGYGVLR